jgi:hypothetical protein
MADISALQLILSVPGRENFRMRPFFELDADRFSVPLTLLRGGTKFFRYPYLS